MLARDVYLSQEIGARATTVGSLYGGECAWGGVGWSVGVVSGRVLMEFGVGGLGCWWGGMLVESW